MKTNTPCLFLAAAGALAFAGCQSSRNVSADPPLASKVLLDAPEQVSYQEGFEDAVDRRRLLLAKLVLPKGHPLALAAGGPVPNREVNDETDEEREEARLEERGLEMQRLPASQLKHYEADLEQWLQRPVEVIPAAGQTVAIERQRDFVYPKSFHDSGAGWLRRTLATEALGFEASLSWQADPEDPDRSSVSVSYSGVGVATYDRTQSGQHLPVFVRESLSGRYALGIDEALLFGSHWVDEATLRAKRDMSWQRFLTRDRDWVERWLLWLAPLE